MMLIQAIKNLITNKLLNTIDAIFQNKLSKTIQNLDEYIEWLESGKPVPAPNIVKQKTVIIYATLFKIRIFIETGTYKGDMVSAVKGIFDKIYTVELGSDLYKQAKKRFCKDANISILHGDSASILPQVLKNVNEPCLFWLDAHYSAGCTAKGIINTPILQELGCIFNHHIKDHVILIDDARDFNGKDDYPSLHELQKFVSSQDNEYKFEIENDIIRIYKEAKQVQDR